MTLNQNLTLQKIGHQYMNRIAIDEEAAFEITTVINLPFDRELVSFSEIILSYPFEAML